MKKVILQLFLNKHKIVAEIEKLQSVKDFPSREEESRHRAIIDAKHKEWDKYEHMIDLFFEGIGM